MLGVKAGDHAYGCQQGQAAEDAGRVTASARHDRAAGLVPRLRLVNDLPRHGARTDVRVTVIASWEMRQGQVQPCSGVTDLRGSTRTVYKRLRGGRARWQREQETVTPLQNQGDHGEHNDGHGEKNRAVVCAMLRRLAFVGDQTPQRCGALWRAVWAKCGRKRRWRERLRALCYDARLAARRERRAVRYVGCKKSHPLRLTDSSSTLCLCLRGQEHRSAMAMRHGRCVPQ
jgi:hypothetical protein